MNLTQQSQPETRLDVEVVSFTDKGPVRLKNEDSIVVVHASGYAPAEKGTLMVVADGIGGMRDGSIASSIVTAKLPSLYFESNIINPVESLVRAIKEVNQRVHDAGGGWGQDSAMGSTVAACVVVNGSAVVANVGDSRVYLLHEKQLRQLSRDHSLRREFFSPFRAADSTGLEHVLTQAIGPHPTVNPHVSISRMVPGDIIFLCSDGITSTLSDVEVRDVLVTAPFSDIASVFQSLVYDRRGDDNFSLIAARLAS